MAGQALKSLGKTLAGPLSSLMVNPLTERYACAFDTYWSVLLGKGAGTGWAIDAEMKAAAFTIRQSPAVIFDVGANIGEWSERYGKTYPQAKIYAFEPQPACHPQILARRVSGLTLVPHAVSSVAGQVLKLHCNAAGSGISSLHERRDSFFSDMAFSSIDVNTVTVDNYVRDHGIATIDFMKMDVEGHELGVLQGAAECLRERRIKAMSFEFGAGNINSRTYFHDFWDLLHPLGYDIFRVLPSGRPMRIRRYYEDCEYFRGVTNYVAMLNEPSSRKAHA